MDELSCAQNEGGIPLLQISDVSKRYGNTQALAGVELSIDPGEVIGMVGHNGAGKSTLMRIICGQTVPDTGTVRVRGMSVAREAPLNQMRALGIQIAFQELSLAPTVRVFENTFLARPSLAGWGWRRKARKAIVDSLDEIFPGHGISANDVVESLSLAQRQMIEIAQTNVPDSVPLALLILDEPTSALGYEQASNLFTHVRKLSTRGVAIILISHKMGEILANTVKTVIMRDGHIVGVHDTNDLDADSIVSTMSAESLSAPTMSHRREVDPVAPTLMSVADLTNNRLNHVNLSVAKGEIVGVAGLDGQGQQELLKAIYHQRRGVHMKGKISFVSGDRQRSGVFPLWTTGENIGIGIIAEHAVAGVVNAAHERTTVTDWMERLAVRGSKNSPIVDLSGGNQQKALSARALATSAELLLLDDPFRGVDVDTRRLLYLRMREGAVKGRSFLWFTTENAELQECDRVLVMSHGRIVKELAGDAITEEHVIAASFAGEE